MPLPIGWKTSLCPTLRRCMFGGASFQRGAGGDCTSALLDSKGSRLSREGGILRRLFILFAAMGLMLATALPAQGIIHELVASHCSGYPNIATIDPPGQLNERGNSFARALQASGIYDVQFGVDQGGVFGLDFDTFTFGPMPSPGEGEGAVTVFVDNTRPNAKLGDFLFWAHFTESLGGQTVHVYLEIYELDHPAFEHCPNFPGGF